MGMLQIGSENNAFSYLSKENSILNLINALKSAKFELQHSKAKLEMKALLQLHTQDSK